MDVAKVLGDSFDASDRQDACRVIADWHQKHGNDSLACGYQMLADVGAYPLGNVPHDKVVAVAAGVALLMDLDDAFGRPGPVADACEGLRVDLTGLLGPSRSDLLAQPSELWDALFDLDGDLVDGLTMHRDEAFGWSERWRGFAEAMRQLVGGSAPATALVDNLLEHVTPRFSEVFERLWPVATRSGSGRLLNALAPLTPEGVRSLGAGGMNSRRVGDEAGVLYKRDVPSATAAQAFWTLAEPEGFLDDLEGLIDSGYGFRQVGELECLLPFMLRFDACSRGLTKLDPALPDDMAMGDFLDAVCFASSEPWEAAIYVAEFDNAWLCMVTE